MDKRRYDATQEVYEKFMNNKGDYLFGFSTICRYTNAVVLTDDVTIYKTLLEEEKLRLKEAYRNYGKRGVYQIQIYKTLGLSQDELSKTQVLYDNFKYAVYCKHKEVEDWYFRNYCGGGQVIVLTKSEERLKEFLPSLVEAYIKEMGVNPKDASYDKDVPPLYMQISVNNKKLRLSNDGEFKTRLSVLSCAETLSKEIDLAVTDKDQHETKENNERKKI